MSRFFPKPEQSVYAPLNAENDAEDVGGGLPGGSYPPPHTPTSSKASLLSVIRTRPARTGAIIVAALLLFLAVANYASPGDSARSSFPSKITRISTADRSVVYRMSNRVDIGLEFQTVMEFKVPPATKSSSLCHIRSHLPFVTSIGTKTYETWGDVSEIEIWRVPPSVASSLPYDQLSYETQPSGMFGELVGLLDFNVHPVYTSEGFDCGSGETLAVVYRCLRVACKAGWIQTDDSPKLGLELVRGV